MLIYSSVSLALGVRRREDEAGRMGSGSRRQTDYGCRLAVKVVVAADMIWQWCLGDGCLLATNYLESREERVS